MDLCALALPAGFRADGLPFGVTIMAPAFREAELLALGERWQKHLGLTLGAMGWPPPESVGAPPARKTTEENPLLSLLVFGLHLSGEPLNPELTALGGALEKPARTAACYKMALIRRGERRFPGVWRMPDGESGAALSGEIWSLPLAAVGSFLAGVRPPLCLGSVELEDGTWVKGFMAESAACETAKDISGFGGWRAFLAGTDTHGAPIS
jgi:allophanate hydrolase